MWFRLMVCALFSFAPLAPAEHDESKAETSKSSQSRPQADEEVGTAALVQTAKNILEQCAPKEKNVQPPISSNESGKTGKAEQPPQPPLATPTKEPLSNLPPVAKNTPAPAVTPAPGPATPPGTQFRNDLGISLAQAVLASKNPKATKEQSKALKKYINATRDLIEQMNDTPEMKALFEKK